ncbi:SsgA family sporulation/cell division regulator [Streptomyces europaeiscabiei]|uniref:SsgA family sporulation/cell division regulator n=1 Tax=Streptomyces europaeiscabiei TaxID=146819 RepID=A0ABU4NSR4_9ACTN|nr:SsgA family sporulation/cell division regulator [Streptomyces europaeiscabiei]MDX2758835.1 SsgA family sporulation/cell division regulator [Streptomyces europaeiscabiei]MDX2769255.1 SsgA family sporulation/cell division regulator [Streptomyces europaeiscabiei]MDX3547131.1 SsgA family sporulation/cell division regulator [Streptomyces europaeiscabiei]MDX3556948.1 SsgA family sporulation/cell division regulator [Streptomyces europaeiscabiei]MDX3669922.1 SsgA family sporulation/cell division re
MSVTVEQYARAHVVTDSPEDRDTVPVVLRYDTDASTVRLRIPGPDTSAVRERLPGPDEWTFPRDLLERGLRTPTSSGPVSIWPCGRVQAVMEFHSAQGVAVMQFDTKALIRFLRRTYTAVPVAH